MTAPILFLYGSLRRGMKSHEEQRVAGRTRFLGDDRLKGRMLDLVDWPAYAQTGEGTVHGELHLVRDASLLADLDRFERALPGCPGGQLFERRSTRTLGGYEVQVYAWLGSGRAAPLVMHGDWKRHVHETGMRR